jgi:hypothetical protein
MKSNSPKKQVLDNSMMDEDFFEGSALLVVSCPLPSYRFVWQINQSFPFRFERNHNCEIFNKNVYYEVYHHHEADKLIDHYIYTNRKKTSFLINELKSVDFIWLIKGSYYVHEYAAFLRDHLARIPNLGYTALIDAGQLHERALLIL